MFQGSVGIFLEIGKVVFKNGTPQTYEVRSPRIRTLKVHGVPSSEL